MCGRFTLTKDNKNIAQYYNFQISLLKNIPRYNIAPTQEILGIINSNGINKPTFFKWGLIPSWSKDENIGRKMINARAETVDTKPSFSKLLKHRRCLIPSDGFYEWKSVNGIKTPFRIIKKNHEVFSFAGLWDEWVSKEGNTITTCTIITTTPNELVQSVHNRMPVILTAQGERTWLNNSISDTDLLKSLLISYPAEEMDLYRVSTIVNSPANDTPECIKPIK